MRYISLYFFALSIFWDFCGFMKWVSPKLFTRPLLSGTGFSVYLSKSNTESCDEHDGEEGESLVEEELAD